MYVDPILMGIGQADSPNSVLPVTSETPFPVSTPSPGTPYSAQATVGTSAAALASHTFSSGAVALKADDDNAGSVYLGPSGVTTSTGYRLKAGQSVPINLIALNSLYAIASQASQKLYILGT